MSADTAEIGHTDQPDLNTPPRLLTGSRSSEIVSTIKPNIARLVIPSTQLDPGPMMTGQHPSRPRRDTLAVPSGNSLHVPSSISNSSVPWGVIRRRSATSRGILV